MSFSQHIKEQISIFLGQKNLKKNSLKAYNTDLNDFVAILVALDIQDAGSLATLLKSDIDRQLMALGYNDRVRHRRAINIRLFLKWLKLEQNWQIHDDWLMSWKKSNSQKASQNVLMQADIQALVEHPKLALKLKLIIHIILEVLPTLEEVANLKWQDYILKNQESSLILGQDGNKRIITISQELAKDLMAYKEQSTASEAADYIWQTKTQNQKIEADYISYLISHFCKKYLERDLTARDILAYAKIYHRQKYGLQQTMTKVGKKQISSLIVPQNISDEYIQTLKNIHQKAFTV